MKIYFVDRGRMCSFAGRSKRKLKRCRRAGNLSFRSHKVCEFHLTKLEAWRREGRI